VTVRFRKLEKGEKEFKKKQIVDYERGGSVEENIKR